MTMIMHIADIHLGARPYGFQERWQDILDRFSEIAEIAVREKPDLLVIAGDLFDKPKPDNEVLKHAVRELRRITGKGIPVIAAHGEHDTPGRRDSTVLQVLEAAVEGFKAPQPRGSSLEDVLSSQVLEVRGVTVGVYPYRKVDLERRRQIAKTLLPAFSTRLEVAPRPRVFLAHFSLDTVFPIDAVASPLDLPRVEYIALGHVHTRHIELGNPVYTYPGSLEPLNIAEARSKAARGPLLVDLSGDVASVQEIPVEVRPHMEEEAEARSPQEALHVIRRIASKALQAYGGRRPLVHIRLRIHPGVPVRSLYQEAERLRREAGLLVRLLPEKVRDERGEAVVAGERIDPLEVLVGDLKVPRGAAVLVLELKDALLSEDEDRVVEVLEKLSAYESQLERWIR